MKNNLFTATQRFSQDRKMVLQGGSLIVLLLLVLGLFWLKNDTARITDELANQEERLDWMRRASSKAMALQQRLPATGKMDSSQTLLGLTDKTLRASGLEQALSRIEPDEKNAVRVWFEKVMFDQLIAWLNALQKESGVGVSRIAIKRGDKIGEVQARLTLSTVAAP